MSQWDLQANETNVYFKNYVHDEVVEAEQKEVYGRQGKIKICIRCDKQNIP